MSTETTPAPARSDTVTIVRGTVIQVGFLVVLNTVLGLPAFSPGTIAALVLLSAAKLFVEIRYPQHLPKYFIAAGAALFLYMLSAYLDGALGKDRTIMLLGGSLGLMLVLIGSFQWWSARSRR